MPLKMKMTVFGKQYFHLRTLITVRNQRPLQIHRISCNINQFASGVNFVANFSFSASVFL